MGASEADRVTQWRRGVLTGLPPMHDRQTAQGRRIECHADTAARTATQPTQE